MAEDEDLEELAYESYCEDVPLEMPLERRLARLAEDLAGASETISKLDVTISPIYAQYLVNRTLVQLLRDMIQTLRHKVDESQCSLEVKGKV